MGEDVKYFKHESATCKLTVHSAGADLTHVYSTDRGKGHATELLKTVMAYADEHGLKVWLSVKAYGHPVQSILSNEQLIEFYKKFGFDEALHNGPTRVMFRPSQKKQPL